MGTYGPVLAGVLLAAALAASGWGWRSTVAYRGNMTRAMSKQSEALAVLVAEQRPVQEKMKDHAARLNKIEKRIGTLSESTAVLAETLEHHEDWHKSGGGVGGI